MQNFFLYMLARKTDHNWLRSLLGPVDPQLLETFGAQERHMWCTGGFLHVAGQRILADATNQPVFSFDPVRVTCPDKGFEQIYCFRWWTFRKHLKQTPDGFVFTEFLDQVGHAAKHNTISCALGHHIREGRWLRDRRYIDEYARFWYTGHVGVVRAVPR